MKGFTKAGFNSQPWQLSHSLALIYWARENMWKLQNLCFPAGHVKFKSLNYRSVLLSCPLLSHLLYLTLSEHYTTAKHTQRQPAYAITNSISITMSLVTKRLNRAQNDSSQFTAQNCTEETDVAWESPWAAPLLVQQLPPPQQVRECLTTPQIIDRFVFAYFGEEKPYYTKTVKYS